MSLAAAQKNDLAKPCAAGGGSPTDLFAVILSQEHVWTRNDIGKNSLSSTLGDLGHTQVTGSSTLNPLKQSREITVAYVPPVSIRKIKYSDFEYYLQHIQPVYDSYLYASAVGVKKAAQGVPELTDLTERSTVERENVELNSLIKRYVPNYVAVRPTNSATEEQKDDSRPHVLSHKDRMMQRRLLKENLKPVSSIPKHFFEPEFQLMLPSQVDLVTEKANLSELCGSILANLKTSKPVDRDCELLAKLRGYSETAELHLINEITQKSQYFFSTLQNLESLNSETSMCVEQIASLRVKLQNVSTINSKQGLEIVRLKQKRNNLSLLHNSVKLIQDLKQTQPMIQVLLGQGDYSGALDLIEEASKLLRVGADLSVLNGTIPKQPTLPMTDSSSASPNTSIKVLPQIFFEQTPGTGCVVQMQNVRALLHFTGQLREVAKNVGLLMEADFVHVMMHDLQEIVRTAALAEDKIAPKCRGTIIEDWVQALALHSPLLPGFIKHKGLVTPEEESWLKSRMQPLISGLIRLDRLSSALHVYVEKSRREVNTTMKKYYPEVGQASHERQNSSSVSGETSASSQFKSGASSGQRLRSQSITAPASNMNSGPSITGLNSLAHGSPSMSASAGLTPLAKYLKHQLKPSEFLDLTTDVLVALTHLLGRAAAIHYTTVAIAEEFEQKRLDLCNRQLQLMQEKNSFVDASLSSATIPSIDEEDDGLGQVELGVGSGKGIVPPQLGASPQKDSPVESSSLAAKIAKDSLQALCTVADESFVRVAKLLAVRVSENVALEPLEFISLYNVINEFCRVSETLCNRQLSGTLKSILLAQTKKFFAIFHDHRLQKLAQSIENECWAATSVSTSVQELADLLLELKEHNHQWSIALNRTTKSFATETTGDGRDETRLNLQTSLFYVVETTLTFLRLVWDYTVCFQYLNGSIGSEVLVKLMDCMKVYNSRICQVILGAGALKSVGLKNITTKHIVLAAQSLASVVLVMTHLRPFFLRLLSSRQQNFLKDFDKICKDYVDHESELFGRLVRLMEDRLLLNLADASQVQWDKCDGSIAVHSFSQAIVKDTLTLCKVLLKYLTPAKVGQVMEQTFTVYVKRFEELVPKLSISTTSGKAALQSELEFISRELGPLYAAEGGSNAFNPISKLGKLADQLSLTLDPAAKSAGPTLGKEPKTPGYFSSLFGGRNNSSKSVVAHRGLNQTIQIAASPVSSTSVYAPTLGASTGAVPATTFSSPTAVPTNTASPPHNVSNLLLPDSAHKSLSNLNDQTSASGMESPTLAVPRLATSCQIKEDGSVHLDLDAFLASSNDIASSEFIERLIGGCEFSSHYIQDYEQRKLSQKKKANSDESFKVPEPLPDDPDAIAQIADNLLSHIDSNKSGSGQPSVGKVRNIGRDGEERVDASEISP